MNAGSSNLESAYFDDPASEFLEESKRPRFFALIAILIASLAIGTTLATNVNLGSDTGTEFGQGVQLLAACSGSTPITITPIQQFVNQTNAGTHFLSGFTVTNVPQSCANRDFRISTYDSSTPSALSLFSDGRSQVIVNFDGSNFVAKGASSCNYTVSTISNSGFVISITNPSEAASIFSKFTLESAEVFSENTILKSDTSIALSGCTSITFDHTQPPSITDFSQSTISLSSNDVLTITGVGFTTSPVIVKFWRNKQISVTSGDGTTLAIPVAAIAAAGATTGRVVVTTPNGQAVSPTTLTILP